MRYAYTPAKLFLSLILAIALFFFLQYVMVICPSIYPGSCHSQLPLWTNILFGLLAGIITYTLYSLLQKKKSSPATP